jgi:predicted RNA-binding protein with PIN domain
VIVVDAANVVGSRPDGWWKDRAGAARRLVDEIIDAVGAGRLEPPVVVVLEGDARDGVAEGEAIEGVGVVHAPGEGDETIEAVASESAVDTEVVVVTADRRLSSVTGAAGALVRGPRWLREKIEPPTPKGSDR